MIYKSVEEGPVLKTELDLSSCTTSLIKQLSLSANGKIRQYLQRQVDPSSLLQKGQQFLSSNAVTCLSFLFKRLSFNFVFSQLFGQLGLNGLDSLLNSGQVTN